MNDCDSFAGKMCELLRKSVKILDQMRKLRSKIFENDWKRLKIFEKWCETFENIWKMVWNVWKYLKISEEKLTTNLHEWTQVSQTRIF